MLTLDAQTLRNFLLHAPHCEFTCSGQIGDLRLIRTFSERPSNIQDSYPHRNRLDRYHLRHHHHDNIPLMSPFSPLLADKSKPRECVPGGNLEAYPLGHVCLKRSDRCIPIYDTASYVVEVKLEVVEEDCSNDGTERWCTHHCIRNPEEHLCYCGKSNNTFVIRSYSLRDFIITNSFSCRIPSTAVVSQLNGVQERLSWQCSQQICR
jgi:hypothetical protein